MNNAQAQHILSTGTLLANGHAARKTPPTPRGITTAVFEKCLAELIARVRKEFRDELEAARAPLERRIAELEARPAGVKWAGTFEAGRKYDEGDLATHAGGLWLALRSTFNKPGDDAGHWQLVVKRGEVAEQRFPTAPRQRHGNTS